MGSKTPFPKPQASESVSLDSIENIDWLKQLADEAGINILEPGASGDSWVLLEQIEMILRHFTKLYRETGHVDPNTYEDFADQMQDMIDALRAHLGHGDMPAPTNDDLGETQLELELVFALDPSSSNE